MWVYYVGTSVQIGQVLFSTSFVLFVLSSLLKVMLLNLPSMDVTSFVCASTSSLSAVGPSRVAAGKQLDLGGRIKEEIRTNGRGSAHQGKPSPLLTGHLPKVH